METTSREYIRHPAAIPIGVTSEMMSADKQHQVVDVSEGGLCFACANDFNAGDKIHITISVCRPEFNADGIVCWCKQNDNDYLIGVVFMESDVTYALRMVEQICHIENYRQESFEQTGVKMSSEKAAMEWIQKYAAEFPNP
jgi:PilZ domain-containing protein